MNQLRCEHVLTGLGAREYFQGAINAALVNQRFAARGESVLYLVNLLTSFLRSEHLFERTPDGMMIKPLAEIYGDALTANSEIDRTRTLQRLGDIALFVSGLYAHSLGRSLVDVDYYIAMGGNAYSYLADRPGYSGRHTAMKIVFDELSVKFAGFVEILAEVSEQSSFNKNTDVLRLYELWQLTGSERAGRKLHQLGIHPIKTRHHSH